MDYNDLFIKETLDIKSALKQLDVTAKKVLFITDGYLLKGTLTDGDIRRWILKNGDLSSPVYKIMNTSPIYIKENEVDSASDIMRKNKLDSVPIVDEHKLIKDVIFWNDDLNNEPKQYENISTPVVIMAGGKGTRLAPYTNILPKPLIPIGDTPIIERIINKFVHFGCCSFYLSVSYKKNMIKAYFSDMIKSYNINYIEESKPLGTAGSLSLLKGKLTESFFVSNCDILVDGDYRDMLKYHKENNNKITLISSLKHFTIPYGIVKINKNSQVHEISEKPEYDFLVNTGMYILEPECLEDIPEDEFYHITDLINQYLVEDEKVGIYPVSDKSWMDMGQHDEMEKMIHQLGLN